MYIAKKLKNPLFDSHMLDNLFIFEVVKLADQVILDRVILKVLYDYCNHQV